MVSLGKPQRFNSKSGLNILHPCLVAFILLFTTPLYGQKPLHQSTTGNQSPAISAGGNVNITYGFAQELVKAIEDTLKGLHINDEEVSKRLQELLKLLKESSHKQQQFEESLKVLMEYVSSKDLEIHKLKKRLTDIHKVEFDSLPEEADRWASHFISTLPLRKEKLISQEDDRRIFSEKEKAKIPIVFDFVISDFDSRMMALKKHLDIYISKRDFPDLFGVSTRIRKVTFQNGSSIELVVQPGSLTKGLLNTYPSVDFYKSANNQRYKLFSIWKPIGGTITFGAGLQTKPLINDITYSLDDNLILSQDFRNRIASNFDKMVEIVLLTPLSVK